MLKISLRDRYQSAEEVLRALNLEPYLETLTPCMSSHPLNAIPDEADLLNKGYLSPIVRTAIAIRRWRTRRLAKEQRQDRQDDRVMMN
jgi:serine/threonine-protein kinase